MGEGELWRRKSGSCTCPRGRHCPCDRYGRLHAGACIARDLPKGSIDAISLTAKRTGRALNLELTTVARLAHVIGLAKFADTFLSSMTAAI